MVKTEIWYYLCNTRSGYFPITRHLYIEREIERARESEREAMSICETMQTQKQYYLHNTRFAYFPINRRLCRESVRERDRLCPSVKLWTHRNSTISIIQDLHISLPIADCMERESKREREAMSIHQMVKTQKQYYLHHMRSGYFPINRRLHRQRESREKSKREREAMSICERVKTQKWYYLCNTRSPYFPRERERLCPSVK